MKIDTENFYEKFAELLCKFYDDVVDENFSIEQKKQIFGDDYPKRGALTFSKAYGKELLKAIEDNNIIREEEELRVVADTDILDSVSSLINKNFKNVYVEKIITHKITKL
jgi:hypothetical protein